ncbi:RimK/LysX family protein [uncultured Aliiroseovarius sp.]|uniref:ATP-dependent zinc protease family protein n=1 Tax=uncultured Aliiroseovarius sp. TaxID=1658783 RepID=UPI00261A079C|nr:RimK/LysX family protein [uncultured Aliiroseovarius sp.]
MKPPKKLSKRTFETIGWRENVGLPDFGISRVKAKIDTGARTSALHAEEQQRFFRDDQEWVRFLTPVNGKRKLSQVEAQLLGEREIKNTGGIPERRLIVRTTLLLGRHCWHIEVSLADRKKMEFDLILGRTAIRGRHVLVDPGSSFLAGPPRMRDAIGKSAETP